MSSLNTNVHRLNPTNKDGVHRITHGHIDSESLLRALGDLSPFVDSKNGIGLYGLREEVSSAVLGDERPVDAHIRNYLLHTDPEEVRRLLRIGYSSHRNHVSLSTNITARGNLSVTIAAAKRDGMGRWSLPPEWRKDPFSSHAEITQRPENEVLFIRNVRQWFSPYRAEDHHAAARRNAACAAINLAFWLVVYRLSCTFNVQHQSYVAGLSDTPFSYGEEHSLVGLEIVNQDLEVYENIESAFGKFTQATGHSPEAFYTACNLTEDYRRFDKASKLLRAQTPGSEDLTPKTVERYFQFLEIAEGYGIWHR